MTPNALRVLEAPQETRQETQQETLRPAPPPLHAVHPRADHSHRLAPEPVGGPMKRTLDVALSAPALVLLAPFLGLIALAIVVDSRGPVLFRQTRGGFRGLAFRICKFRTMIVEEDGQAVRQAQRHDDRVTRVGRLLRRCSLDELPQLYNVLVGDMSLVGPRPHAVRHDNEFARLSTRYRLRQLARPGITGLAQVSGARGETETPASVRKRLDFDLRYIETWNFSGDLRILFRTLAAVIGDDRAY